MAQEEGAELLTQPRKVEAQYQARLHGLTVFAATLTLDISLETYRVRIDGRTAGVGAMILPATAQWRTAGRIVEDRFMPLTFVARREWPGSQRSVELTFDRDGRIVTQHLPPVRIGAAPRVPEELQRNSFDPLTALLNASARPNGEPCDVEARVYDGDRRLDIGLQERGYRFSPVALGGGGYRQIHYCGVNVVERGAEEAADAAAPQSFDLRPTAVWVARVHETESWIPVAASFDTRLGPLELELTDVHVEDRRMN